MSEGFVYPFPKTPVSDRIDEGLDAAEDDGLLAAQLLADNLRGHCVELPLRQVKHFGWGPVTFLGIDAEHIAVCGAFLVCGRIVW